MLTVEQILNGCTVGRLQSVGQMAVIPILDGGEAQDDTYAPPNFEAGTRGYGTVSARNTSDRPTIMPTGAAFLTPEAAQDHAVPGASLFKGKEGKEITNSYCVQQTQGGLIPQKERDFAILPAALRVHALSHRKEGRYDAMWEHIRSFRAAYGDSGAGNLVEFVKRFEKELDQFVAEFELVEKQVGALVLVAGKVVGIERAPNVDFWRKVWNPLIRVCYGSLALKVGRENRALPETRLPLTKKATSIDNLRDVLKAAQKASTKFTTKLVETLSSKELGTSAEPREPKILTVASQEYAGQVVSNKDRLVYASICVAAA